MNKVGVDFVGLLVLGFVNAAVGAERVRPDIHFRRAVSARAPC